MFRAVLREYQKIFLKGETMKLFIKLVLIAIYHNKYIDWEKVNQELCLSLAGTGMMFHPEDKPFNQILNNKELHSLLQDK